MDYRIKLGAYQSRYSDIGEETTCIALQPPLTIGQISRVLDLVIEPYGEFHAGERNANGGYSEIDIYIPAEENASETTMRLANLIGYVLKNDGHAVVADPVVRQDIRDSQELFDTAVNDL